MATSRVHALHHLPHLEMFIHPKPLLPPSVSRALAAPRHPAWTAGSRLLLLAAAAILCLPRAQAQSGATLTSLYSFTNGNDGSVPDAELVQGSDGNFYGTTQDGGANSFGTVFQITPAGVLTTLYTFSGADGAYPSSALVVGSDGNFYSTTAGDGTDNFGTVFRITPAGVLTTLYSFSGGSDGGSPSATLTRGSDGNFYGTTQGGGANDNGTIFQITPAGALTTLHSFTDGTDGSDPIAALTQGSDGNFYGTNYEGGPNGDGTIYKITPSGVFTTLYSFTGGSDGSQPFSKLVLGGDGNFYGTTDSSSGPTDEGSAGGGTVYRITPAGALTTLYNLTNNDGALSNGLVLGSDGNFYGTTYTGGDANGDGTIYKVTPAGAFTLLYSFDGTDGSGSDTVLLQGNDGSFYGTTTAGGMNNDGTIFRLAVPGIVASPGSVQLSVATANVTETTGSVTLLVNRILGGSSAISVNYATADDTAFAGTDYQATSGTLTWADGDIAAKMITVPILNRNLTAGSTFFLVNLSSPGGGAALASPAQAAVTILDTASTADIVSVTLLSPPAGVMLTANQPVVLQADVEALSGTLANVEFFAVDSAGNRTDLGGTTSPRGHVTWQPTAAGTYTLQVVATDSAGNTQQTASSATVVAAGTTAPQTSLYGGLDGITVPMGATVPVVAQAVDSAGNALQSVQFYLDGVPVTSAPLTAIRKADPEAAATGAGSLFVANVVASKIQQIMTAVGVTSSGVSSVSNVATIYGKAEAGAPPTASISNLASGASVPVGTAGQSVSVAASSGSQPIAKVQLVVDNQNVGTATAAPYSFSLPSLPAGAHILSIIATDVANLSSVSTPVMVTAQEASTSTPAFFTGEVALANGVYYLAFPSGNFFGYYSFLPNPAYIFHFDLGFEYVFDAADGKSGVYFYDFASSTFFYTSPSFPFPYLYDFTLNSVLYYYPDPNNAGHYNTEGVRYFYDFNTGKIISK